jgi:hypothetical protein
MMNIKGWVIPWYREQDWPEWCSLCKFKGSHKDWLSRAEADAKAHESLGRTVVKVVIEPRKFLEWCRTHRGEGISEERMIYAILLADAREEGGYGPERIE